MQIASATHAPFSEFLLCKVIFAVVAHFPTLFLLLVFLAAI